MAKRALLQVGESAEPSREERALQRSLERLSRENGDLRRQLEAANAALMASESRATLLGYEATQLQSLLDEAQNATVAAAGKLATSE